MRRHLTGFLLAVALVAATTVAGGTDAHAETSTETKTFTGTASATGASWLTHSFVVSAAGPITATLDWTDPGADLNLFLRAPDGTFPAQSTSATTKPEVVTTQTSLAGEWKVAVKARVGATPYTVTVSYPITTTGGGGGGGATSNVVFDGQLDAGSTNWAPHRVDIKSTGTVTATLDWSTAAADLNLFAYHPSGSTMAQALSASARPETVTFTVSDLGVYRFGVKAKTGSTDYTLTVSYPSSGASTSPAQYASAFGYVGPAGLYAYGVDVDETDNTVVVADVWNYRIMRFANDGRLLGKVSQNAKRGALGGITAPFDVEADAEGNVWGADQTNGRVVQFDHNGKWIKTVGHGGGPEPYQSYPQGCGNGSMYWPTNLLVHPVTGDLYVSDPNCGDIYVYDSAGRYKFAFNLKSKLGLTAPVPRGLDIDADRNIYVVEHGSRKIWVFSETGTLLRSFAARSDLYDARGLSVDRTNGYVYVADAGDSDVNRWKLDGTFDARLTGSASVPFHSARYVATDAAGNLFVADTWGYRVWKFNSALAAQSWATPAQPPPNGGFNQVNGIGLSPSGRLFAVDTFENRMQAFNTRDTAGNLLSCAGRTQCPAFAFAWGRRGYPVQGPNVLNYPRGLTANAGGVWVGDAGVVLRYDHDGNFISRWGQQGPAVGQIRQPFGMRVIGDATSGTVWLTDINCRLQSFDYTGKLLSSMGACGGGANQMDAPRAVDVRGDRAYVADMNNNRILVWDLGSRTTVGELKGDVAGVVIKGPEGVVLDPTGTMVYIADSVNRRIVRMSVDGSQRQVVSTGSDTPEGAFLEPEFLEFGPDGLLYVSDNNMRVYALRITS